MSLEDNINRYVANAREIVRERAKKAAKERRQRRGTFKRLNNRGGADVSFAGRTISVKLKTDTYKVGSEDVLIDNLNVVEEKRRRVIGTRWRKKWINGKLVVDEILPILGAEEDVELGPVIIHTSFMVSELEFENYMGNLVDIYFNLDNIHGIINLNLFGRNGPPPYIANIFGRSMPQEWNVSNATQDVIDIFAEESGTVKDITRTNALKWAEDLGDFYEFLDEKYVTLFGSLPLVDFHETIDYNAGNDLQYHYDFMENGQSVFWITKLDWVWDISSWPHTDDFEEGSETTIDIDGDVYTTSSVYDSGTSEVYPYDAYYGGSASRDITTSSVAVSPTFVNCTPGGDVECPPCNCGTGWFGCNYYSIVYIYDGQRSCDVLYRTVYDIGNLEEDEAPTHRVFSVDMYHRDAGTRLLYGTGDSYTNADYVGTRRFASARAMMRQTIRAAQAEGYLIVISLFDTRLYHQTPYGTLTPIFEDPNGPVRMYNTFDTFVEMCQETVFFHYRADFFPDSPRSDLAEDQITKWRTCTNNAYDFVFDTYGGVTSADFSSLKVLYIQPHTVDFFNEWRINSSADDELNPRIGTETEGPLLSGNDRIDSVLEDFVIGGKLFYDRYKDNETVLNDPASAGEQARYLDYALASRYFGNFLELDASLRPWTFI